MDVSAAEAVLEESGRMQRADPQRADQQVLGTGGLVEPAQKQHRASRVIVVDPACNALNAALLRPATGFCVLPVVTTLKVVYRYDTGAGVVSNFTTSSATLLPAKPTTA